MMLRKIISVDLHPGDRISFALEQGIFGGWPTRELTGTVKRIFRSTGRWSWTSGHLMGIHVDQWDYDHYNDRDWDEFRIDEILNVERIT